MTGAMLSPETRIGGDERAAVDPVVAPGGGLAQCSQVEAFGKDFAEVVGGREWVAVNLGWSALKMALIALGSAAGDEVIVPFTLAATGNTVDLAGTTPVCGDVIENSFSINPEAVKASITSGAKAVKPVHLYRATGAAHSGRGPLGEDVSWVS